MNLSRFKRKAALLLTLAYASVYLTCPLEGAATVFASGSSSDSSQVNVYAASSPTVTLHPQSITAYSGKSVKFSVKAQGSGTLRYQWYYKKDGASDWSLWKGHTTATTYADVNSSWNMMQVRCKVSDSSGSTYSNAAVIKVDQPLVILTQPKNVTVKVNDSVKFSVTAQGKGQLKYQWYYKKDGASDWSVWKGRTSASTTAKANSTWNRMSVRCKVSDDAGSTYSSAAVITVNQPLTIVTQPQSVSAKENSSVKFTVQAQGKGQLKYQWYYMKSGASTWSVWKGHTSASTSGKANVSWNLMKVRCKVSDDSGKSVYSSAAVVNIELPLRITTQPKNVTVKPNGKVTFSVKASGTGTPKYQWYYKKDGATDWSVWSGRTSASLEATANATWNMMQVYCKVSDASGSVDSSVAVITVDQPLTVLTQPKNITVKSGSDAEFSVTARGKGTLKYQWYYKKDGQSQWTAWSGYTTASISAEAASDWNMMQVRCKISDASGSSIYSSAAVVTVNQPLVVVNQPQDTNAKTNQTVNITVKAQGTGAIQYQWYYKKLGASDWSVWKSQTKATVNAVANDSWNGMQVYCKIKDASGASVNSKTASIWITGKLKITSQPSGVIVKIGDTAVFKVEATCENSLSYQWYYKKAGRKEWTLWSGKTTPQVSGVADCTWHGMQVYCKITDSKNNSLDSKTAYALITKQSSKRYFTRSITVRKNSTKVYSGVGTDTSVIGTVSANSTYVALEWDSDSNDTTWYCFSYNGGTAWVPRTSVKVTDDYTQIPDRKFNDGGIPMIYLSPSRQTANSYAVGNTTEQAQMYRVAEALKKILEDEYYCMVYIPPVSLKLGLKNRAYDAYIRDSDVYLAIHSNSNPNGYKMHGATGYYSPNCNQSKVLAQNIINEMAKVEFKKSNVKDKMINGMTSFDNTGYGEVRDPSYYGMIGVLAEVEYHHYNEPAKWIINNPDKIARALANSLESTLGMQKK